MRGDGFRIASSIDRIGSSGSYSTSMAFMASNAASSSTAATAATGSPTRRTLSRHSACSSWLTGRIPKGIGRSFPVRTARTPGIFAAFEVSTRTRRACGTGDRCSLQNSIRGRTMSSANFVTPAHFDRPSTLRTAVPTTRRARWFPRPPPGARTLDPPAMEHLLRRLRIRVSHPPGGQLDRLEDLDVPSAAAQIAGQRLADLLARRFRPGVEERLRGAQNSGSAVAALRGAELRERHLQWIGVRAPRQPFDRDDRPILALEGEDQTRELRPAVEEHRAGAALPQLAAVLGPGQAEIFAQDLEQRLVGREGDLLDLTVDVEAQVHLGARGRSSCGPLSAAFHLLGHRLITTPGPRPVKGRPA